MTVDHIDRDASNNHIENLRLATQVQQQANRGTSNVYFDKKKKKYRARLQVDGERKHIGHFNTFNEAQGAANAEKKKRQGAYSPV
jgi:hypothetical protein